MTISSEAPVRGVEETTRAEQIPVFKPLIELEKFEASTRALELGWLGMGSFGGAVSETLAGWIYILDDVNFIPPCRQAVMDYRSQMGISALMHEVDWNASWWQKPDAASRYTCRETL